MDTRLTFSVIGKGQKQRDMMAGRIVSKRIWAQISLLSDDEYLFAHQNTHYSR